MKFRAIESLLGEETVAQFESLVASALSASSGDDERVCALRELLVALLAGIVTTKTYLAQSERLASEDAARLRDLVATILRIQEQQIPTSEAARAKRSTMVLKPANSDEAGPPAGNRSAIARPQQVMRTLQFRCPRSLMARQPTEGAPEAERKKSGSLALSRASELSAQRIARSEAIRAQTKMIVAQSQALLAKARMLTTSLQQSRNFTRSMVSE
jgi:hypothetical protein